MHAACIRQREHHVSTKSLDTVHPIHSLYRYASANTTHAHKEAINNTLECNRKAAGATMNKRALKGDMALKRRVDRRYHVSLGRGIADTHNHLIAFKSSGERRSGGERAIAVMKWRL
jgi:hypothetical protein